MVSRRTARCSARVDYVAPEQIRGDEVAGGADVYALGCMLFECLTGEGPFRRPSEVATLFAHLEEDPPSASARHSALPAAIDPVLARALAKEPGERHSSCAELVADASAALGLDAARPRRLRLAVAAAAVRARRGGGRSGRDPAHARGGARPRRPVR